MTTLVLILDGDICVTDKIQSFPYFRELSVSGFQETLTPKDDVYRTGSPVVSVTGKTTPFIPPLESQNVP